MDPIQNGCLELCQQGNTLREAICQVIADEIYADMTFGDPFTPHAEVSSFCILEMAKRFLEGFRESWLAGSSTH